MIWGVTLHPGEECTREIIGEEHLSIASLECRLSKYSSAKCRPSACLLLKTNAMEHVICTLEKGVTNQQCLDLIFEEGEKITFMAEGTGIIYLTGYTVIEQQDNMDEIRQGQAADTCIFIRDQEEEERDDGLNYDKMPNNQEDEEVNKEENECEVAIQDKKQPQEGIDNESITAGLLINGDEDYSGTNSGFISSHIQVDGNSFDHGDNFEVYVNVVDICDNGGKKEDGNEEGDLSENCNKKSHLCEFCGKAFKKPSRKKIHELVHTNERLYGCRFCEKKFKTTYTARRHETIHTRKERHKCHLCPKTYMANAHLVDHMRSHTGERPFQCDMCGALFSTSSAHNRHIRNHKTKYPFQCQKCGKGHSSQKRLENHFQLHTEKGRIPCRYCGKLFVRWYHRNYHEKTVHRP